MCLTRCLTVLASVLVALALPSGARAAPPSDDPFYGVPANIGGLENGTIIDSRAVVATRFSLPIDANAWQVRFKTQDTTGAPSAYITTVLVPKAQWTGKGPRPVLSYQMPEDGVGLKCAPSWVLTQGITAPGNTTPDAQTVASAVGRGWTVVVPDYQGPNSAWLGGEGQARGVLDSLRAARAFKPAGIDPDAPIGVWGYSGGAIASSTAAQMQPSYAADVKLAGVALGGNNASIRGGLAAFDGTVFGGAIAIGFIGLDRAYPAYKLADHLNDAGRAKVAQSQEDCIVDAALRHPLFRAADNLKDPAALDRPPFTDVFRRASPLTFPGTPDAPVYDYHATGDELAPIGPSRQLLERFCRAGVTVQQVEDAGEHFTEVVLGEPGAVEFLTKRFAGDEPAVNTCKVAPDPTPEPPACTATARTTISQIRLRRRSLRIRGSATPVCGRPLKRVTIALARVAKGRCRFLGATGRLGRPRSCARAVGLRARGTRKWRLARTVKLPAGRYTIAAWAERSPKTVKPRRRLRLT